MQMANGSGVLVMLGFSIGSPFHDIMALLLYFTVTLALAFVVLKGCVREQR
jgi:hypothetical protein